MHSCNPPVSAAFLAFSLFLMAPNVDQQNNGNSSAHALSLYMEEIGSPPTLQEVKNSAGSIF